MFSVYIPTTIDFNKITRDFIRANDEAITVTAATAVSRLRALQPVKTGELQSEVAIKFFKQKNKLRAASLKVIGRRYFVSVILENGTKDGRIKARHTFEQAAVALESMIEATYTNIFFTKLEELGGQ